MVDTSEPAPLRFGTTLLWVGVLATLAGLATSAGYADHLLWLGEPDEYVGEPPVGVLASVGGCAIVVVSETLACLLFTGLAAVALTLRDHQAAVSTARAAAVLRVVWVIGSLSTNYSLGWYYILDPSKRGWALMFGVLCVAQTILAIVAATTPEPREPPTPLRAATQAS